MARTESDAIGSMEIPDDVYYGIHTARALDNFPITGIPLHHFPKLVRAFAMVKKAATRANCERGELPLEKANAIIWACDQIIGGKYHDCFVVDMIQGGAGTSTNMNANEVIANVALEKLGYRRGDYDTIHPNDHVNLSQSTNDVYPTAVRLALMESALELIEAQRTLSAAFKERAEIFDHIVKVGRTQLQDAVPMTLGAEFASFAATLDEDVERVEDLSRLLCEINLGGTAIGTGINTYRGYAESALRHLSEISGMPLSLAPNLIEATSDTGAFITFSGVLKRIAVKLSKVCNDLRLLSSGPRAGIGEIRLPPVQAGSSIMPGKVNPVIPEVVNQVAFQVIGNDLTVTLAAEAGQLQLNAMEPVIVFNLLQSMSILRRAMNVLTEKCVKGIEADEDRCRSHLDSSLVLATALVPHLGYEVSARIAKRAAATGERIRDIVLGDGLMSEAEIDEIASNGDLLGPRH